MEVYEHLEGYESILAYVENKSPDQQFRVGLDGDRIVLSLYDALRAAGYTGSSMRQYVEDWRKTDADASFVEAIPVICIQAGQTKKPKRIATPMGSADDCLGLVRYFLLRSRKMSSAEKDKVLEEHGLGKNEFKSAFLPTVETDTLTFIKAIVPHESVDQFEVGKYRIDCYFPDMKLAVECDEHGHADRDKRKELQREIHIREALGCLFFRYNPHEEDVFTTVRRLVSLLTSPEYRSHMA